jgi:hypothetical protein
MNHIYNVLSYTLNEEDLELQKSLSTLVSLMNLDNLSYILPTSTFRTF